MGGRVFLGLGSNLEDREGWINRALERLERQGVEVVRRSSIYETEPVGFLGQPDFLNLAVEVRTDLDPPSLMKACLEVEGSLGRQRGEKNGPRNIDIDLLYFGDAIISAPGLNLPHPRIAERAFVLAPLAEIAPDFRVPDSGRTVAEMLQTCPDHSHVQLWKKGDLMPSRKDAKARKREI